VSKPPSDDLVNVTFAMKRDPPGEDPWPYPPGLVALSAARDRVVKAAKAERALEIEGEKPAMDFTRGQQVKLIRDLKSAKANRKTAVDALNKLEAESDNNP
jgi:hypothetical protein